MTSVGFVIHAGRPAAVDAAERLRASLEEDGISCVELRGGAADVDLVVAVGGDGTFLRGAYVAAQADSPVLGVKVGRLGFLTEVEPPEAAPLIREALEGRDGRVRVAVVAVHGVDVVAQPDAGVGDGRALRPDRTPLVDADIEAPRGIGRTDDQGYFQMEVGAGEVLTLRPRDGRPCRLHLGAMKAKDGYAAVGNVICQ